MSRTTNYPVKKTNSQFSIIFKLIWGLALLALSLQFVDSLLNVLSNRNLTDNTLTYLSALILAGSIYHYFKKAPSLPNSPSWLGLSMLCLTSLVTSFGLYFHFSKIAWLGFLSMAASCVWAMYGYKKFLYWRPVFLFSITLIPIESSGIISHLSVMLKNASLIISTQLARLVINFEVNNYVVTINGQQVEITSACSGLSILTSLTFIVMLWQLIKPVKVSHLILMIILCCFTGVVTNGIRLFITFLAINFVSLEFGLSIHSNIEILLLPFAMLFMYLITRRLVRDE